MGKYEKFYRELRKTMTDEEIADSMIISQDLTPEEEKKAHEEIKEFRFKLLRERTEEQRIDSDLLRLRFQTEDYLNKEDFTPEKTFGKIVEEYARILKKTKKQLSEELGIHYTRLSRIINDREEPNVELTYRLEKHSGELIPALLWWKLIAKKMEYNVLKDKKTRKREAAKVKPAVKKSRA